MNRAVPDARPVLRARPRDPVPLHTSRTFTMPLTFPARPGVRVPRPAGDRREGRSCRCGACGRLGGAVGRELDRLTRALAQAPPSRSTGRDRCVEQVRGSLPAERLARSLVDLGSDPREVLNGVHQVSALREVVAQQPVHVLVASPAATVNAPRRRTRRLLSPWRSADGGRALCLDPRSTSASSLQVAAQAPCRSLRGPPQRSQQHRGTPAGSRTWWLRSTSVPIAVRFPAPMIRSPSQ